MKVDVNRPRAGNIIIPSACGAVLGLRPALDDVTMCREMNWTSSAGVQACNEGNVVQALRFAWDDWSKAASSLSSDVSSNEAAVLEVFSIMCCMGMVHLMQGGLPHAALQVAHIADACSGKVSAPAKRCASHALLLVSCNATLALASIGGGGGLREWLHPLRASCREVLSQLPLGNTPQSTDPAVSTAVACAHSVQGALQALDGGLVKASASLDDALSYMRCATSAMDVGLLSSPRPEANFCDLLQVREVVHDSAVVTWNMCVVFCSGPDSDEDRSQKRQCYDYALAECVKFTSAAGSDPGRPLLQKMCTASRAQQLYR